MFLLLLKADRAVCGVHPPCLLSTMMEARVGPYQRRRGQSNLAAGQLKAEEFVLLLPILLAEVANSTTVVYDASSYARPDDAVEGLLAGSAILAALTNYYGTHYGRSKLHWAIVIALIEAHKDKAQPVASFGNGIINEFGRKLFGGEAQAADLYRNEGWTIWDIGSKEPRTYLQKDQSADGDWWYQVPLGGSRRVLTRLRVRSVARPCPARLDP